jgi:hypothetical protein
LDLSLIPGAKQGEMAWILGRGDFPVAGRIGGAEDRRCG